MKKMLKIIGIIILVIAILFVGLLVIMSFMQSVPSKYWEKVETGGEIEKKYSNLGNYEVEKKEYEAPKTAEEKDKKKHFVVWYPKEKGTYPLIVMVNGTGVPCDKYEAVFRHFTSLGYVVIGNDYGTNWDGKHPSETLDFALSTKEIADIIDEEKIGIGGHSQGGMGTFNAVTHYENGSKYKVMFSISPTNKNLALGLKWVFDLDTDNPYAYDLSKVSIPTLMTSATGNFDTNVAPLEELNKYYDEINADKVMFRKGNLDHGDMLYQANGYIIAWLDYYLKDVKENEKAFYGEDAEIYNNNKYQDVKSYKLTR